MFNIISTQPGDENFYLFENFPSEIYNDSPYGIGVPEPVSNEYLEACFIITEGGKIKGRGALYNNQQLKYHGKKAACVGNFEAVNNRQIAGALLQHISAEAKKTGAFFLIGPMNGSTWNSYRFSLHHNNPPFFMEPVHHLYYNHQFLENRFDIIGKYFSSIETDLKFENLYVAEREKQLIQSALLSER
ncbi:MAG: hypothetical protein M3015_09605 [Bacteroidota bacterium]|nr:hypothetical protein [Bacteroidota bacterium]